MPAVRCGGLDRRQGSPDYLPRRIGIRAVPAREEERFITSMVFPRWTNRLRAVFAVVAIVTPLYVVLLFAYGASTEATDVGYAPVQPIPYSHALHAGELGIDCRYCHTTVETAATAALPPTLTCINCHSKEHGLRQDSQKLALLRESFYGSERRAAGLPIPWVRVHDLPDYAYFNHSAHVTRGVGCVTCHGRVDRMEVVYQAKPLSMSWCLECHRDPGPNLRPLSEITNMTWTRPAGVDADEYNQRLLKEYNIRGPEYLTSCSVCHR